MILQFRIAVFCIDFAQDVRTGSACENSQGALPILLIMLFRLVLKAVGETVYFHSNVTALYGLKSHEIQILCGLFS